jgi:mannose-6-phosphate isomerase-like protein (cupin superfamily)
MMHFVHGDSVFRVPPGTQPDYDQGNPLLRLMGLMERTRLASGLQDYLRPHLQYLFPIRSLELYGPSAPNQDELDPAKQDVKVDFQKQNVRDFIVGDTILVRGYVSVGERNNERAAEWTGPFLRISYRGEDTPLEGLAGPLGDRIGLMLKVGSGPQVRLQVPRSRRTGRYEVEIWGYPGSDLAAHLGQDGKKLLESGELLARPDIIRGQMSDFDRAGLEGRTVADIAPDHAMHPILPLHVELAWFTLDGRYWDSQSGANYHYEFNMVMRGWDNHLSVGGSDNPHGGIGTLEYRNLLSNYFQHGARKELGRTLEPWNFDALGAKHPDGGYESFMAVDYMDLHLLHGNSGIGLHRHRDNQEIFLCMRGQGLMVVGDWCKMPNRERSIEIRTLRPGHLAMLKGGQMHGLMNTTDETMHLFMFGGYD